MRHGTGAYGLLDEVTAPPYRPGHVWNPEVVEDEWRYVVVAMSPADEEGFFLETLTNVPRLVAAFEPGPVSGVAPLMVPFSDASIGDVAEWVWDFDSDGVPDSTMQSPVHVFDEPGVYSVSLRVEGRYGVDTRVAAHHVTVLADADGDEVSDESDNCPDIFNPEQVDGDGDTVGDACDVCPDDIGSDADYDSWCPPADCNDGDPSVNPAVVEVCGDGVDNDCDGAPDCDDSECADLAGSGCAPDCMPGDIFPEGGDGVVDLRDYRAARRKAHHRELVDEWDLRCGDLAPGAVTCRVRRAANFWCPAPDGRLRPKDANVIKKIARGGLVVGCAFCEVPEEPTAVPFVPGDLAPMGAVDGVVTVGDVVFALRVAVGLNSAEGDQLVRGDVAPKGAEEGGSVAGGDGAIDIADVVAILDAAAGVETLRWPRRELEVAVPSDAWLAAIVELSSWPAWATVVSAEAAECLEAEDADVLEFEDGVVAVSCVADLPAGLGRQPFARVVYRAAGPVDVAALGVQAAWLDGSLEEVTGEALVTNVP
jgi:PKD repeat protein